MGFKKVTGQAILPSNDTVTDTQLLEQHRTNTSNALLAASDFHRDDTEAVFFPRLTEAHPYQPRFNCPMPLLTDNSGRTLLPLVLRARRKLEEESALQSQRECAALDAAL